MTGPLDVFVWGEPPTASTELPQFVTASAPGTEIPRGLVTAQALRYARQEQGTEDSVRFDVVVDGRHYGTFVTGSDGWRWS